MCDDKEDFEASKLGTKEYWDELYEKEIESYRDAEDEGEVWFGEESVKRVIAWMKQSPLVNEASSVLDLGCGNGNMLTELADKGYTRLYGVDYSENAITMARSVAQGQNKSTIQYQTGNILCDLSELSGSDDLLAASYDVLLDKGTYDAISLCPDNAKLKRHQYANNVRRLMTSQAVFIITSCNWTQDQLLAHFTEGFRHIDTIPSATFQFGGQTGNRETVLVFQLDSSRYETLCPD